MQYFTINMSSFGKHYGSVSFQSGFQTERLIRIAESDSGMGYVYCFFGKQTLISIVASKILMNLRTAWQFGFILLTERFGFVPNGNINVFTLTSLLGLSKPIMYL